MVREDNARLDPGRPLSKAALSNDQGRELFRQHCLMSPHHR
ncbi:hypothetical protein ACPF8X_06910 [Streptomyces sp. G35A]